MTKPTVDINRIVREVQRRLSTGMVNDRATLDVTARVVSLAELEGRLEGIQCLTVRSKAVITPAVRDLLRERDIAIQVDEQSTAGETVPAKLIVGITDATFDPKSVETEGTPNYKIIRSTLLDTCRQLTSHVASGKHLGLWITGDSIAAACLANRNPRVRAACVMNVAMVRRAVESLGANLLVLDPAECDTEMIKKMVHAFCDAGLQACPERLRA